MARKIFISFLGGSVYHPCKYTKGSYTSEPMIYIQKATLEYLMSKETWEDGSKVYILLTEGAEKANWVDNGVNLYNGQQKEQIGLQTELNNMHGSFDIIPIKNIPEGKDEGDIWKLFKRMYEEIELEPGDDLYLDVTHGFRYLPMLMLSFSKYVEFLKQVHIKSVTYGNFESTLEVKPIMDFLPIVSLQDWTYAAGQFVDNGIVKNLVELSEKELNPILRDAKGGNKAASELKTFISLLSKVVDDLNTCRGINIVKSEKVSKLKKLSINTDNSIIEPLNPVLGKIKESFSNFDTNENVMNGFAACKWCLDNHMYQQAATILHENLVTYICCNLGFDWTVEYEREHVNIAFDVTYANISQEQWNLKLRKNSTEEDKYIRINNIKRVIENKSFSLLITDYNQMRDLRNDYNHSGIRPNPRKSQDIKSKIGEILDSVMLKIKKHVN